MLKNVVVNRHLMLPVNTIYIYIYILWSILLMYTLNYFKKILLGFIKAIKFFNSFFNFQ